MGFIWNCLDRPLDVAKWPKISTTKLGKKLGVCVVWTCVIYSQRLLSSVVQACTVGKLHHVYIDR